MPDDAPEADDFVDDVCTKLARVEALEVAGDIDAACDELGIACRLLKQWAVRLVLRRREMQREREWPRMGIPGPAPADGREQTKKKRGPKPGARKAVSDGEGNKGGRGRGRLPGSVRGGGAGRRTKKL